MRGRRTTNPEPAICKFGIKVHRKLPKFSILWALPVCRLGQLLQLLRLELNETTNHIAGFSHQPPALISGRMCSGHKCPFRPHQRSGRQLSDRIQKRCLSFCTDTLVVGCCVVASPFKFGCCCFCLQFNPAENTMLNMICIFV